MTDRQGNGRFGHYGLEFVFNCSAGEVDAKIAELRRDEDDRVAKPNRMAKANRQDGKGEIKKLQRRLKSELGNSFGKAIEAELNRKFRQLYKLRQKS